VRSLLSSRVNARSTFQPFRHFHALLWFSSLAQCRLGRSLPRFLWFRARPRQRTFLVQRHLARLTSRLLRIYFHSFSIGILPVPIAIYDHARLKRGVVAGVARLAFHGLLRQDTERLLCLLSYGSRVQAMAKGVLYKRTLCFPCSFVSFVPHHYITPPLSLFSFVCNLGYYLHRILVTLAPTVLKPASKITPFRTTETSPSATSARD
jgi:hypothetical protein